MFKVGAIFGSIYEVDSIIRDNNNIEMFLTMETNSRQGMTVNLVVSQTALNDRGSITYNIQPKIKSSFAIQTFVRALIKLYFYVVTKCPLSCFK